jgi:hypothetical protein
MNIYNRIAPNLDTNTYQLIDQHIKLNKFNSDVMTPSIFENLDLAPTYIFPQESLSSNYNQPSYHNDIFKNEINSNLALFPSVYPNYYPENENLNSASLVDVAFKNSSVGRTVGPIQY